MVFSRAKRVESWLRAADFLLVVAWCAISYFCFRNRQLEIFHLPILLQTSLAWAMGFAWYVSMMTVGGQNPLYLHPRYRIFISSALALGMTAVVGIFWAGSGHDWYLKGGILFLIALGVGGIVIRLILALFLQRPALQLVPCRLPVIFQPLLQELSRHPQIFIEQPLDDPASPLPERRPRYPIFMAVSDLRLREADFHALLPLYSRVEVVDICELYENFLNKVPLLHTTEGWFLPQALRVPSPIREVVKRICDTACVLATAPISVLIVALSIVAIKFCSPGPAFFAQERLGRYGKPFRLYKLRTMIVNAETAGRQWSGADDPRVTPIGRWLRATAIDELPQLWNVLRGDMSLVGPRPECPEIAEQLEGQIPFYGARMLVAPGITGWAQLHQAGDVNLDDVAHKLRYDLYYLKNGNIMFDFRIILGTLQMLLHLAKPTPAPAPTTEFRVPSAR